MAKVKSFRVHPKYGIPDHDISEFLNLCEKEGFISVNTIFIPAIGESNPRITVIVTKLDNYYQEESESPIPVIKVTRQ